MKNRSNEIRSNEIRSNEIRITQELPVHENIGLFTVTFGEKVLTLAKSRGSLVPGYGIHLALVRIFSDVF